MVLEDTFIEREGAELTLGSDVSDHVERRQVAGSWHLFEKPTEKGEFYEEHQVHARPYRHEIEIFYFALKYAEEMVDHPHLIIQYMDCK